MFFPALSIMQALYMDDCYLEEFDSEIKQISGNTIVLDKTAFYPAGGGQPTDTGKIVANGKEFAVLSVAKQGGEILHNMNSSDGLSVGDKIRGIIDWNKRYVLMRHHTAAHVLSGVFNKESGAMITGNQLDIEKSRIDFSLENFDRDQMTKYFEIANELVAKNLPVNIYYISREEAEKRPELAKLAIGLPAGVDKIRVVDIVGFDAQADGGTHVKSLKEIGKIEFVSAENKGKSNRRIYYKLS